MEASKASELDPGRFKLYPSSQSLEDLQAGGEHDNESSLNLSSVASVERPSDFDQEAMEEELYIALCHNQDLQSENRQMVNKVAQVEKSNDDLQSKLSKLVTEKSYLVGEVLKLTTEHDIHTEEVEKINDLYEAVILQQTEGLEELQRQMERFHKNIMTVITSRFGSNSELFAVIERSVNHVQQETDRIIKNVKPKKKLLRDIRAHAKTRLEQGLDGGGKVGEHPALASTFKKMHNNKQKFMQEAKLKEKKARERSVKSSDASLTSHSSHKRVHKNVFSLEKPRVTSRQDTSGSPRNASHHAVFVKHDVLDRDDDMSMISSVSNPTPRDSSGARIRRKTEDSPSSNVGTGSIINFFGGIFGGGTGTKSSDLPEGTAERLRQEEDRKREKTRQEREENLKYSRKLDEKREQDMEESNNTEPDSDNIIRSHVNTVSSSLSQSSEDYISVESRCKSEYSQGEGGGGRKSERNGAGKTAALSEENLKAFNQLCDGLRRE